jgi:Na+-transporting NADH:ubiquinone oxidoreductase subunit NqrB
MMDNVHVLNISNEDSVSTMEIVLFSLICLLILLSVILDDIAKMFLPDYCWTLLIRIFISGLFFTVTVLVFCNQILTHGI